MAPRRSARDEPGKLREYESIIILRPDLMDDGIATINNRVQTIIDKHDGRVLHIENWGRRRLAYRIGKEHKGNYYYWRYLSPAVVPGELKRSLRVLDTVLREFTIKQDANVDPDARPADVDLTVLDPTTKKPQETQAAPAGEAEGEPGEAEETKEVKAAEGEGAGEGKEAEVKSEATDETKGTEDEKAKDPDEKEGDEEKSEESTKSDEEKDDEEKSDE